MATGDRIIIGQANTATRPNPTTPAPETSLSRNDVAARTVFVARNLNMGNGIRGEAVHYTGVDGRSTDSVGVYGASSVSTGVYGVSGTGGPGAPGTSTGTGVEGYSPSGPGVRGTSGSVGVRGTSGSGTGVDGISSTGRGVRGYGGVTGVEGISKGAPSTHGIIVSTGVFGHSEYDNGTGVHGSVGSSGHSGPQSVGVAGYTLNTDGTGVQGLSFSSGTGVSGSSPNGVGVLAHTNSGIAVDGISESGTAVFGHRKDKYDPNAPQESVAGYFDGGATVANGDLTVINGNKPFKIDHPLDPENKYLLHNAVESSERKNVYDGVAQLDEDGEASVDLPEWFEALNGDFRYQLTGVGGSAPGLHVAEEVSENRFKIAGGEEGMKVCWQVTGTRKDPWAAANPFEVEQEKPEEERGRYLEPSLYDAPEEQRVMMGPVAEAVEEEQRFPEPPDIDFARLEEERRRQTDELRREEEEQRQEMEELRRRMEEREEEAPPGAPAMPPDFGLMEEEHRRQIDELRGQIEELRRGRVEEEIDELRRQIKKLRRRRKQ
jgi:hypothetical protein